jgi:hypothetical protein
METILSTDVTTKYLQSFKYLIKYAQMNYKGSICKKKKKTFWNIVQVGVSCMETDSGTIITLSYCQGSSSSEALGN